MPLRHIGGESVNYAVLGATTFFAAATVVEIYYADFPLMALCLAVSFLYFVNFYFGGSQ